MENAVRKYIDAIAPELIALGVLFIAVAVFSCRTAVEAKSASEKLTALIPLRLAVNGFVATSTRLEVPPPPPRCQHVHDQPRPALSEFVIRVAFTGTPQHVASTSWAAL
jgi:hypothetical protein